MSILLKSVELNGQMTDIHIEGNTIKRIISVQEHKPKTGLTDRELKRTDAMRRKGIKPFLENGADAVDFDLVIDGRGKAVIPGLMNMHTHAAMTLFRGFGDDMPLIPWLEQKIWPNEKKMTYEDIYWGAKLACVEMLRSGTTTFFDMYYQSDATAQAVEEMGLRAVLAESCFDHFDPLATAQCKKNIQKRFSRPTNRCERIQYALGPHAIYTVSGELLRWIADFTKENDRLIHLHLAETEGEVSQCVQRFGTTPVRYLHQLKILSPRLILAHVLYVDDEEIQMLADNGVKVVHNPASNMKLGSGYRFKYKEMREAGLTVAIGTDGCSSSNNLDMIEAMKIASLLGKSWRKNPEALTCNEMFHSATQAGADMLGIQAGRIEVGGLADVCLIDLLTPAFTPNHHFISNLVFAANGSCVDTVICNGRLVMSNKKMSGENEILEKATNAAYNLLKR
jgi:5-methylthioadenosine/S-adenosylhomocysteine deaminase